MPACALSPHLEHGAILEDVLLVTHHAVLIERRDPLLRILHDLRERMVGVSPRCGHGTREDALGSGMGISGMWRSREDAPGSGMVLRGTWGSGEDALGSGTGISGMWGSGEDAPGSRMELSRTRDSVRMFLAVGWS